MSYSYKDKRAGWDDLYEEYFEDIEKIMEDNIVFKHNNELIEKTFFSMLNVLEKASEKMKLLESDAEPDPDAKPTWSPSWHFTFKNIKDFADAADTINKKVIAITMIDQFLRATY